MLAAAGMLAACAGRGEDDMGAAPDRGDTTAVTTGADTTEWDTTTTGGVGQTGEPGMVPDTTGTTQDYPTQDYPTQDTTTDTTMGTGYPSDTTTGTGYPSDTSGTGGYDATGGYDTTAVPGVQIYILAFTQQRIGLASALAVLLMLLVLVVILPIQRLSRDNNA